jgi:DNA-binding MarR family transcriptional regulator
LAEELDESVGMPLSWFEVLLRISRSGGQMKMADIADQVVITTGGITKLIDRLIEQGYIKRQPCNEDRRIVWACITDKGTKAFKEALTSHNASLKKHMSGLTDSEIQTVSKIMNKLK